MRKVVVEVYRPDSLELYIHTDMLFSPAMGEGTYHNIVCVRESGNYDKNLTPVAISIMEKVEHVNGVGTLMYGRFGFSIRCGRAFDRVEILNQILAIINRETGGDGLMVSAQLSRASTPEEVCVFDGKDSHLELPQLSA